MDFLQDGHLVDGGSVEFPQALSLLDSLVNHDGVEAFQIGQADEFVDGGIVADVAGLLGLASRHSLAVMPNIATFSTSASSA